MKLKRMQIEPRRCAGRPVTAYTYDWNLLPMGENRWIKELMSYKQFPPLQAPATYTLDATMALVRKANAKGDQPHFDRCRERDDHDVLGQRE
jgi:hypothetical protein